jgi:hypothetical protein
VKSGANFYEFKPSQNTWISRASFPGQTSNGGAGFYRDDKGYFVCGYVGALSVVTNEVWEYNAGQNAWNLISIFPGTARRFPVAFAIGDKGYFGTGTNGVNFNDFWCFDYDPLGVSELNGDPFVCQAYPNPSTSEIRLLIDSDAFNTSSKSMIEVFTCTGERILSSELDQNEIIFRKNEIGTGIFMCRITLDNSSVVKKLILH